MPGRREEGQRRPPRAAAAGWSSYLPGGSRDGSGAGSGGRQTRARATSVVRRENGVRENPALCSLLGAGGEGGARKGGRVETGALAMLKSARGALLLLAAGARGVFGGLRAESGRALSPPAPQPAAVVGTGAALPVPPARPGKCGCLSCGRGGAGPGEGPRHLRGAAGCYNPPSRLGSAHLSSPHSLSAPQGPGPRGQRRASGRRALHCSSVLGRAWRRGGP